jgi:hypothetical protein
MEYDVERPARKMTGGRVEETPRRQTVGQTVIDVCWGDY